MANVAAMPGGGHRGGRADADGDADDRAERPAMGSPQAAAVAYWPDILEYQTHTNRTFPLIVLYPVPDSARPNPTRLRAAKARFDREGASSPIPLSPETTPGA